MFIMCFHLFLSLARSTRSFILTFNFFSGFIFFFIFRFFSHSIFPISVTHSFAQEQLIVWVQSNYSIFFHFKIQPNKESRNTNGFECNVCIIRWTEIHLCVCVCVRLLLLFLCIWLINMWRTPSHTYCWHMLFRTLFVSLMISHDIFITFAILCILHKMALHALQIVFDIF